MKMYIYLSNFTQLHYFQHDISEGTQKFPELLKKLFKVFVQVWNFSPLRSTLPATGCSNPSTTPNAGNIVFAIRWRPLTAFPLQILDNVSSIGSDAGIAASSRRGSTSKELKFQTCTNTLNNFFNNSGNFWVPPRIPTAVYTEQHLLMMRNKLAWNM